MDHSLGSIHRCLFEVSPTAVVLVPVSGQYEPIESSLPPWVVPLDILSLYISEVEQAQSLKERYLLFSCSAVRCLYVEQS